MQGWTTDTALEFLGQAKADVEAHHVTLEELNFGVKLLDMDEVPVADLKTHEKVTAMR